MKYSRKFLLVIDDILKKPPKQHKSNYVSFHLKSLI